MSWVNCVCGRLKGDFRYSVEIVYNNFPFPENPSEKQIKRVEEMAKIVLEIRKELENSSLATLYDPITIPSSLVKAHQKLDKAVDLCYRPQVFENEIKRIDFLSDLYDKYKSPLFDNIKSKRNKKAHSKKN